MKMATRERTWSEFKDCGLLWWANRMLHFFGWAIVFEYSEKDGAFKRAYPARVTFRGFDHKTEDEGFEKLTKHVRDNANELMEEAKRWPV